MNINQLHRVSGIYLSAFVTLHLINHLSALGGVQQHIAVMNSWRLVYKNPLVEGLLILAVLVQVLSGIGLLRRYYLLKKQKGQLPKNPWKRWQLYSGLYLAFFLLAHTTATLSAYYGLGVDTNFYFAAMVVQFLPYALFFVPYYALGILSYVVHLLCLWRLRQRATSTTTFITRLALGMGGLLAALILWGLTQSVIFPKEYLDLVGQ